MVNDMVFRIFSYCLLACGLIAARSAIAQDLSGILNFREYSPDFASAGQPARDQLPWLKSAGYDRVIYIALSNSSDAVADEDVVIKELGMDYIHIPVIYDAPTKTDFYTFANIMQRDPDRKTLLHCAANFRASAFAMLYRVLYEDVPLSEAKADMNSVWQPNADWQQLIFDVLADYEISPNCAGCDWTVTE
jgi:protein tyrosine phosphatase (PTP) superfamily phosphohydrolase (DUF442 family)